MGETPSIELLSPGAPSPRFDVAGAGGQRVHFDSLAGRYLVLGFVGRARGEPCESAIRTMSGRLDLFDGANASLFWISADPQDEQARLFGADPPKVGVFWDFDLAISRAFGMVSPANEGMAYRPTWVVLDPRLRVVLTAPIAQTEEVIARLEALAPAVSLDGAAGAPVLVVPRLFEPDLCRQLIEVYDNGEPEEGGFMRQVEGQTVRMLDPQYKRRKDVMVGEGPLRTAIRDRIATRLAPEVARAFQFQATRIERYIVSCYDAQSGGFFKPHRDNTTTGTAHRKFAVTINLNADDYEGGDLRFPEFGGRTYRAPTGGAVVFSCALMHEALPVTAGRRFAFLPFLYDEEGAKVREANLSTLAPGATRPEPG